MTAPPFPIRGLRRAVWPAGQGSLYGRSVGKSDPMIGPFALLLIFSVLLHCSPSTGGDVDSVRNSIPALAGVSEFWAFRPLSRSAPPEVENSSATGLDRFILHRLQQQGLSFAAEADRATLCRRLYLDLIGLPPGPDELQAFLDDTNHGAIERLVDTLLSSPHYGERWGRQWLDVSGYADSNGYIRHDSARPLAYRYRDYVIDSLNADKPYDRFWLEQLAGDELVDYQHAQQLSAEQLQVLTATHFLRNAPDGTDNTEGNETTRVIERYAVLESLLQTTMSAMFGMTIECARCHDHKFDPIPQRDYYALQAVFYPAFNVREWVQPKDRWIYAAGSERVAEWRASVQSAEKRIEQLRDAHRQWVAAHRPSGQVEWSDDFQHPSLQANWTNAVPDDEGISAALRTRVDEQQPPAAKAADGRLQLLAGAAGDSRLLVTRRFFDWTPDLPGSWIQFSFHLVGSRGADGQPAERIGYYIALHDSDDSSEVAGGNILIDGRPAGGASVHLDYPGGDQQSIGEIGQAGYRTGHRYGVRITCTAKGEYLLQHLVDDTAESGTLMLAADQLPDGALGFELCCSRHFDVDDVIVERSVPSADVADPAVAAFQTELELRQKNLEQDVAAVLASRIPEPEKIAWATDLSANRPEVRVLKRGDYFQPGELVEAGPLSVLQQSENLMTVVAPESGSGTTGRRLSFARWATRPHSRAAALLARVQVDRMWRGHFGRGLVPTPENFGASGIQPTHPELLEWLAGALIDAGWKKKSVHRMIVLSRTYRQTAELPAATSAVDPQNQLYGAFPAHRLEAEQVRDSMLAVAGVLNRQMGGPAVEPVDQGNRQIVLPEPQGAGPHAVDRRSIYIRYRRSQPLTFLKLFDQAAPDPNCVSRPTSTVVGQSLALLNGGFAMRMGRQFARRLVEDHPAAGPDDQVRLAFRYALMREPSDSELQRCCEFLQQRLRVSAEKVSVGSSEHSAEPSEPDQGLSELCQLLLSTSEFLYLQ